MIANRISASLRQRSRGVVAASKDTSICILRRTFFASSTDHTTLLANAKVHMIANDGSDDKYGERSYILIPDGTDVDLALKVDKLHLARLKASKNFIYHAKVVQRSLGTPAEVCTSLLEAALKDAKSQGEQPIALASLSGLTQWVAGGIEKISNNDNNGDNSSDEGENSSIVIQSLLKDLQSRDEKTFEAVKSIATGIPRPGHSVVGQGTYRDAEKGWRQLAHEFVTLGLSEESELYQIPSSGGVLDSIDYLADTSREGLMDAGGSMARFKFD